MIKHDSLNEIKHSDYCNSNNNDSKGHKTTHESDMNKINENETNNDDEDDDDDMFLRSILAS